ncbi:MAG: fatty acid kinase fatty acid binding subunit [Solirubrobacteraceae bacterium]|jgi:DegV family protein with EDD domain|nr:fatty acid kinase fatty acid binding subunit [Solirubrobacteraceae bacterium]
MTVAVVTDSTHYLPADVLARHGVHVVSLYVKRGETLERESEIVDLDAFYERLRSASDVPTTSQPSVGDFLSVYEPLLTAGRSIVSVHLSGAVSGTYGSALQARAQLAERGLGDRIAVIDSRSGAAGLGLAAIAAATLAREGADLAEVAEHAHRAVEQLRIWFCLDTLEYLRRGGRVGGAQAWVGGALKIKPILTVDGEIKPVERVRTAGRAFQRMVEYLRTLHDEGVDGWLVQHIQAPGEAQRLVACGRELFGTEPLFVSEVGPVLGVYLGPGMIGVAGIPTSALG